MEKKFEKEGPSEKQGNGKGGDSRMNEAAKLTSERIENLAIEIREFLLEHEMWVDVDIYFNGKCFTTYD